MTFYKILDFKYMGRSFTAFRNELGFQTFLEYITINNERKYHYVDEMTYMKLSDMFIKRKASFYDDGGINKGAKRFKFMPKIISAAGTAILIASLTACSVAPSYPSSGNKDYDGPQLWPTDFADKNEVIITDDYEVFEIVKKVNLLTSRGMNLYWEEEGTVSFDDVREAIAKNSNIDEEMGLYILNFLDKLETQYPNISLGCFYHNVLNLTTKAISDYEMERKCGSFTATACFLADDSTIYYNKELLDGENAEYIMYHEIGHMLLNGYKKVNGFDTERHFTTGTNTGFMMEEGFDTILIEDVIGVSLTDVAYRLPANYIRIIMDSIGYTLEDYVNGYHVEFENRIKEYLGDDSYNVDNLPYLMEYQKHSVRQKADLEIEDSEFHDLYEVIAGVYFKNNIEFCTSKDAIISLYSALVQSIVKDVYAREGSYTFDLTGLKDGMEKVLESYGIDRSIWPSEEEIELSVSVSEPSRSLKK